MSTIITSASEIPDAAWYVVCTDKFMSGWGEAEGKTNVCIFPCTNEQASRVERECDRRPEMKRVRVLLSKPRLRAGVVYSLFDESASAFYGPAKE